MATRKQRERRRTRATRTQQVQRARRENPELLILANPRGGRRAARGKSKARNPQLGVGDETPAERGELVSKRVLEIEYEHVEDRRGVVRFHRFKPGVEMRALPDGTVLLRNTKGRDLWERF